MWSINGSNNKIAILLFQFDQAELLLSFQKSWELLKRRLFYIQQRARRASMRQNVSVIKGTVDKDLIRR